MHKIKKSDFLYSNLEAIADAYDITISPDAYEKLVNIGLKCPKDQTAGVENVVIKYAIDLGYAVCNNQEKLKEFLLNNKELATRTWTPLVYDECDRQRRMVKSQSPPKKSPRLGQMQIFADQSCKSQCSTPDETIREDLGENPSISSDASATSTVKNPIRTIAPGKLPKAGELVYGSNPDLGCYYMPTLSKCDKEEVMFWSHLDEEQRADLARYIHEVMSPSMRSYIGGIEELEDITASIFREVPVNTTQSTHPEHISFACALNLEIGKFKGGIRDGIRKSGMTPGDWKRGMEQISEIQSEVLEMRKILNNLKTQQPKQSMGTDVVSQNAAMVSMMNSMKDLMSQLRQTPKQLASYPPPSSYSPQEDTFSNKSSLPAVTPSSTGSQIARAAHSLAMDDIPGDEPDF